MNIEDILEARKRLSNLPLPDEGYIATEDGLFKYRKKPNGEYEFEEVKNDES